MIHNNDDSSPLITIITVTTIEHHDSLTISPFITISKLPRGSQRGILAAQEIEGRLDLHADQVDGSDPK